MVRQQALTSAYNDVLLLMAGTFLVALPLTLLLAKPTRGRRRRIDFRRTFVVPIPGASLLNRPDIGARFEAICGLPLADFELE